MNSYRLIVPGVPRGQPRPRAFYNKHTGRAAVYDPGTAEHWKGLIAQEAREAGMENLGFRGTVGIMCAYMFERPRGHYRTGRNSHLLRDTAPREYHAQRPDTDNIRKAVKDTLKTIGVFYDDCQVVIDLDISLWSQQLSRTEIAVLLDLRGYMWRNLYEAFGNQLPYITEND